ncbi:Gfo/Idh/MocA family protein [Propionibacteriaceae bacterium Y2011]|uniref:Gfo/Idh/MocA family protein n=1 Tax=Microlunatus sp. Y2014 TaxID=3418488 RepID=UPI003B476FB8
MSKHRLAILGCGGMEKAHQAVFGDLADRVDVIACVDPVIERAEAAAAALGAPKVAADFREVLDDVDSVLAVLPHHLHHPIGMECLRAGKNVLMEKPLALTEQECRELQAEADAQGVMLMTAYPMRYHPLVLKLKELIDTRAYGPMFHMSIWTEQYTRYEPGHWGLAKETLGGGQFVSHGCHYVDLLLWYCGPPTSGVHVGSHLGTPWMEGEGTSDVVISFENGIVGYHGGTWGAKGSRLKYAIHAQCAEGLLELNFRAGTLTHIHGTEETLLAEHPITKNVLGEVTEFFDAIDQGRPPATDPEQSIQGLQVIWKLYEAEESRTVADLSGIVDHPAFVGPALQHEPYDWPPMVRNDTDVPAKAE